MPGFIAHIGKSSLLFAEERRKKLVINKHTAENYQIERRVVNKFMNDRLFQDADDYFVLVEGVILNNHELINKYKAKSWLDCVLKMYETCGDVFFKDFRGSFSGLFYDKKQDKWLIYTNHIGDKQVFLYKIADNDYLFSSEIGFIVETCKLNELPLSIDKNGAYFSLTHGFCIEDLTLINEVTKLPAGNYFIIEKGIVIEKQYHLFSNKPNDIPIEEAIEKIDYYFRKAIKRAFEKDKEYGYSHITCLSGGLDSRMTTCVAHEMGYTEQLNITFSQSGYLDFSIAQQIATDLHHDWLYKPLDGGDFIYRNKFLSNLSYGNGFMLGHGYSLEKYINFDNLGIIHTGQIGDAVIGSFFKTLEYKNDYRVGEAAYSHELIEKLKDYKFRYDNKYINNEIFCLYTRAFTGANQGLLTFQENSESYSPFTDVDFLEFCYSIPLKFRLNHKIYFDWILYKYPNAANYIWEKSKKKISHIENKKEKKMYVMGYEVPHILDVYSFVKYLRGFVLRRLGIIKKGQKPKTIVINTKNSMNPVDYWYNTNPKIKEFMDSFWEENKELIPYEDLKEDMTHLFKDCVVYDKLQCLSVLSAIKLITSK